MYQCMIDKGPHKCQVGKKVFPLPKVGKTYNFNDLIESFFSPLYFQILPNRFELKKAYPHNLQ